MASQSEIIRALLAEGKTVDEVVAAGQPRGRVTAIKRVDDEVAYRLAHPKEDRTSKNVGFEKEVARRVAGTYGVRLVKEAKAPAPMPTKDAKQAPPKKAPSTGKPAPTTMARSSGGKSSQLEVAA